MRHFERNLQTVDLRVTIPYRDPTVDNSPSSSVSVAALMGSNGQEITWEVTTGPFAYSTGQRTPGGPRLGIT